MDSCYILVIVWHNFTFTLWINFWLLLLCLSHEFRSYLWHVQQSSGTHPKRSGSSSNPQSGQLLSTLFLFCGIHLYKLGIKLLESKTYFSNFLYISKSRSWSQSAKASSHEPNKTTDGNFVNSKEKGSHLFDHTLQMYRKRST